MFQSTAASPIMIRWLTALGCCLVAAVAASAEPPGGVAPSRPILLDLPTALEYALARNPELLAQRQNLHVSAEALAVARYFPTSLNPTVSLDLRPWVFERIPGDGVNDLQTLVNVTWSQPIELGHRTALRTAIAQANYCQTQFNVLQLELTTVVQTYRLHQTALYRREKLEVARQLLQFSRQLLGTLQRQVEATRAAQADLILAQVESQTSYQQLETAEHEYAAALSDLRSQLGIPELANAAEPCGILTLPAPIDSHDDDALVRLALASRPDILAARAVLSGSHAAVELARADRVPVFSIGPAYEKDESGVTFYGLTASTPVPILNAGGTLVRQREAEHRRDQVTLEQLQQRTTAQVRATLVAWHKTQAYVQRTQAIVEPMRSDMQRMERLFTAGESDILKLLQVRQRLLESENGQLDALWAATQSYAELLVAVGEISLIGSVTPPPEPSRPASGSGTR